MKNYLAIVLLWLSVVPTMLCFTSCGDAPESRYTLYADGEPYVVNPVYPESKAIFEMDGGCYAAAKLYPKNAQDYSEYPYINLHLNIIPETLTKGMVLGFHYARITICKGEWNGTTFTMARGQIKVADISDESITLEFVNTQFISGFADILNVNGSLKFTFGKIQY